MLHKHTTSYSSTPNLTSLSVNEELESRRHSIADFNGRTISQLPRPTYSSHNSFAAADKSTCDTPTAINQQNSSAVIPQMAKNISKISVSMSPSIFHLGTTNITSSKEKNNEVASSSEWTSGMPLTPVGSTTMLDDIEVGAEHENNLLAVQNSSGSGITLPVMELMEGIESIQPMTDRTLISTESKRLLLWDKINRFINDLVGRGILGINQSADKKPESGTLYEFVITSLKSRRNPVNSLSDRIKIEFNFLLSFLENNNCGSIKEIIGMLSAGASFRDIISSISSDDEILSFLRLVIRANVHQAVNNSESDVSIEEFNKLEELLLIYCLAIGRITIDTDLCEDIDIPLQNQAPLSKPVWRTSFSQVVDKMLSPTAMLMLHMVYWAMTIANSTKEGYVSNKFPNENILGTIMAIYCSIAITHGSLMNSIRIYRSGKSNPDGSKSLMWSSIFLNTLKDATSLGGSVLSLINIPAYIPIFQAGNLMFSTLFAEALIYRAKEANKGHFNSRKLKLFSPLILLPGFLLGVSSIALPYSIPGICEKLFKYNGGDTRFLMHSLKSVVSNLLTTSNEGLKEANRILVLASICASLSVTTWMFIDINRCEHRELKKELQSFKGYLTFRYLVTVFTAFFSMTDPYSPSNKIIAKATTESLKLGSRATQTIKSTTVSSLSTSYMTTEVVEKVGALYVFLSTCDTGKGIIWEPSVGSFNRRVIKKVLSDSQLSGLHNQFKAIVRNKLSGVESVQDCFEIVVKTLEEIGFLDKLKKIQATDFEPDWPDVFNTVRSMLTVGKKSHLKRLSLNKIFDNNSAEDIPLLMRGGTTSKSVNIDEALINSQNDTLENAQEDKTPFSLRNNDFCNDSVRKLPQRSNNGRFTIVKVDCDHLSSSLENCNTTQELLLDDLEKDPSCFV